MRSPSTTTAAPPLTGKVGRSQVIGPYGVGSVYELRTHASARSALHSVMMAGLDFWPEEDMLERTWEPSLQRILGVREFRLPPNDEKGGARIPSVPFPRWLVCPKCHRLGRVGGEFEDDAQGPRCSDPQCRGRGVPARLVALCFAREGEEDLQPGHIEEFPWEWWAHSKGRRCDHPQMKLEGDGKTASLSGLVVRCYSPQCQGRTGRSLEGVFGEHALDALHCSGKRPWLGDSESGCPRPLRAVLRGASNVYFPLVASAISIPPASTRLAQILQQSVFMDLLDDQDTEVLVGMVQKTYREAQRYSEEAIRSTLEFLRDGNGSWPTSEGEQRGRERRAILAGTPREDADGDEFVAVPATDPDISGRGLVAHLVQVYRLREVRALYGFRRVRGTGTEGAKAPLSVRRTDWLPAAVVLGEGIFVELAADRVARWERQPAVLERAERLHRALMVSRHLPATEGELKTEARSVARLVLVHSLAHLLMTHLALESGYSGAAMRERLYVGDRIDDDPDALGVLIYTATSGSDGTLGGLVRHGTPERFREVLDEALAASLWCSSDPLCIESGGQGPDTLNLAACHACALVPETSCELRNTLLDRGLVIGAPGHPEAGFFSGARMF